MMINNNTFIHCVYKRDKHSLRQLDDVMPKYFIIKDKAIEYWEEVGDEDYGYKRFRLEDWVDSRKEIINMIDGHMNEMIDAIKLKTDNDQFDNGFMVAGSCIKFLKKIKSEIEEKNEK